MKEQISALFQSGSFVGGQWLSGDNTFAVYDKATGEKLADIADAGEAEMQTAIQAAKAAFESWSANITAEPPAWVIMAIFFPFNFL